jgi:hypothetical protein
MLCLWRSQLEEGVCRRLVDGLIGLLSASLGLLQATARFGFTSGTLNEDGGSVGEPWQQVDVTLRR